VIASTLPRNPKASRLFGLEEDYFDEFINVYEERIAEKHGLWRPVLPGLFFPLSARSRSSSTVTRYDDVDPAYED
jgi:hypothetical protein